MRNYKLSLTLLALLSSQAFTTADAFTRNNYPYCGGWYATIEPFDVKFDDGLFSRVPYAFSFIRIDTDIDQPPFDTLDEETTRTFKFPNDYNWGFRAAVGYDFPSCSCWTNYGLSLEYTQFNDNFSAHTPVFTNPETGEELQVVGTLYSAALRQTGLEVPFSHADARLKIDYNNVDLLGHKNILFRNCAKVQVFSGIRYLHVKEEFHEFLAFQEDFLTEPNFFPDNIHIDNKFDGIGPRVGANLFFPIYRGFGITTEASGTLLYGQHQSHYHESSFLENDSTIEVSDLDTHTDTNESFVVGVAGKIALAYNMSFCNRSSLALELGYRGDKYFNIIDNRAFIDILTVTLASQDSVYNTFDFTNKDTNLQDLSFSGPYFSITYHL